MNTSHDTYKIVKMMKLIRKHLCEANMVAVTSVPDQTQTVNVTVTGVAG